MHGMHFYPSLAEVGLQATFRHFFDLRQNQAVWLALCGSLQPGHFLLKRAISNRAFLYPEWASFCLFPLIFLTWLRRSILLALRLWLCRVQVLDSRAHSFFFSGFNDSVSILQAPEAWILLHWGYCFDTKLHSPGCHNFFKPLSLPFLYIWSTSFPPAFCVWNS